METENTYCRREGWNDGVNSGRPASLQLKHQKGPPVLVQRLGTKNNEMKQDSAIDMQKRGGTKHTHDPFLQRRNRPTLLKIVHH